MKRAALYALAVTLCLASQSRADDDDAKAAIADVSLGVSVATFVAPWLTSGSGGLSVGRYF